jgi:hypothetical protein
MLLIGLGIVFSHVQVAQAVTTISKIGEDIDGEQASERSGFSVAMSADGTRIAIGNPYNDDNGGIAGQVRVYTLTNGTWTQTGSDINGEAAGDVSGYSVDMSADGTRIVIGAPQNRRPILNGSLSIFGQVRVYTLTNGTWTQTGSDIEGVTNFDYFGYSVAMSADGTQIAVGSPFNDGVAGELRNVGRVHVYTLTNGTWTQTGEVIYGKNMDDYSGYSIDMSADGTHIAIGNRGGGSTDYGKVLVYTLTNGTWTQTGSDINGEAAGDESGRSVAISADGTRVAIGAPYNGSTDAGHVRVYTLTNGAWTKTGEDIDGEAAGDESGWSVAMSANGTRVAIGAWGSDGSASDAGHVRIYTWTGSAWTKTVEDIDGEAADDWSGTSVAMSTNGTRIGIGAYGSDSERGQVRIYGIQDVPNAPTISSLTAANGSLSVAFTPGTDGGSAITNYKYSIDGINYISLNPATTNSPFVISGLTNGTTYSVTIKALNGIGDSPTSNAITGTPVAPIAPVTPTTPTPTPTPTPTTVVAPIANTASVKTGATSSLLTIMRASKISIPQGSRVTGSVSSTLSSVCMTSGEKISGVAPGKCIVKIKITPKRGNATTTSLPINVIGSPLVKRGGKIMLVDAAAAAGLTTSSGLSLDVSVATSSKSLCNVSGSKIIGVKVGNCSVTITVRSTSGATSTKQLTIRVQ